MVASHAICRPIVPRATHVRFLLGLAVCSWFVAIPNAAAIAGDDSISLLPGNAVRFQAPRLRSTTSLAFRGGASGVSAERAATVQPSHDPFNEPALVPTMDKPRYAAADPPLDLQFEADDAADRRPADCDAAREKPTSQLTINIQLPGGLLPRDHAAECWAEIAGLPGVSPLVRCWPRFCYHWQATCLAYRPLYFEEINLERHGYGLDHVGQPVASGAHFFGTVLAMPYLMAVDPPGECIYTLGHYRPGSCPPWRHHWPAPSALGGVSEAGVITGLIFLIP